MIEKKLKDDAQSLSEERWRAIIENDEGYNNIFFYAVKTTGVFCKPSCKSRIPIRENVLIFNNAEEALLANFRPCKRCKPTGIRLPNHDWVTQITNYIDKNYRKKLTLNTLSAICHGSPYHLHREFKKITRMTPVEYIQKTRIDHAINFLLNTNRSVAEIALLVGIDNTPYFITIFKKITGYTPNQYRELNKI